MRGVIESAFATRHVLPPHALLHICKRSPLGINPRDSPFQSSLLINRSRYRLRIERFLAVRRRAYVHRHREINIKRVFSLFSGVTISWWLCRMWLVVSTQSCEKRMLDGSSRARSIPDQLGRSCLCRRRRKNSNDATKVAGSRDVQRGHQ